MLRRRRTASTSSVSPRRARCIAVSRTPTASATGTSITTFNLQWSLYHRADKAVKAAYSGFAWSDAALDERMRASREQLALDQPHRRRRFAPGKYRAYLAPAAMQEIAELLAWGGFSARALETQQSALARMRDDARLDPRVQISEDIRGRRRATVPGGRFRAAGSVPLIDRRRAGRRARFAADGARIRPRRQRRERRRIARSAVDRRRHASPMRDALAALDTGLAVGNLWYLNYSDRPACRMTGMTRFATFWVENGKVVAPVDVLRFDDTLYRMLGDNLEALTTERELLLAVQHVRLADADQCDASRRAAVRDEFHAVTRGERCNRDRNCGPIRAPTAARAAMPDARARATRAFVAGCNGASGCRTASLSMTPPSFITAFVARSPHCRFS